MTCEKCGYVFQPFETACPRCKYLSEHKCELCGRPGIVGVCCQCHKELCAACLPQKDGLCRSCAPEQFSPAGQSPPQMLRPVTYSTGFFDSIARACTFIGQSLGMAFRDKDMLLPSLFALLINGVIAGGLYLWLQHTGQWEDFIRRDELNPNYGRTVWLTALTLLCYIVIYFFMGMTVNLVNSRLHGRDAKLGVAFRDAVKNAPALIYLSLATLLVMIFTGLLRRQRTLTTSVAAGVIERTWMVATYLIVPIIILEDVPFTRSLDRAKALHWRHFVPIAVGEVAISLVNGIINSLVFFGMLLPGMYFYYTQSPWLTLWIVAGGALFSLALAFTEFVRTAYYTCLYLWAAEREKVGEQARVPAPLAASLAR
jgi:hypothetical protein